MSTPQDRRRPAFGTLLPRMEAVGFRPSKHFGQNFLVDDNMCREVAHAGGAGAGDFVLEIGVGLGFLTHHLLLRGARVLGVEIDERLAGLTREWMGPVPELELLVVDALAGKHELASELVERLPSSGDWHLVSNLPYAIAAPVVALLLRLDHPPQSLTMLVQHELAERFCAAPGDAAWGGLGLRIALTHSGTMLRSVPANLFRPRPKVDSTICRLEARTDVDRLPKDELAFLDLVVAQVFTQRRKRLRSPLSGLTGDSKSADAWLVEAGLDPEARVESLGPAAALALVRAPTGVEIRERNAGSSPRAR